MFLDPSDHFYHNIRDGTRIILTESSFKNVSLGKMITGKGQTGTKCSVWNLVLGIQVSHFYKFYQF